MEQESSANFAMTAIANPLLTLDYEPAFERLGDDFADPVLAAEFPQHMLRFRNNDVLSQLGLTPSAVSDQNFIEAFGQFQGRSPFLAMRYHGYQFGTYNPALGDGRGFLHGQMRGIDGELYDFGTKGSGTTPYSRGGDGRLTLKGGVREVLASEALQRAGGRTSRCLSLIETGEQLWRGDEPSPTRSAVMVRFSRSHIRFGTFERLDYFDRKDLIAILFDHVIEIYYPHLLGEVDRYALCYAELVQRVAELVAQWMSAGFCHAVLNTDNMSITGESFDYGPFAFIPTYDPNFTAAYFDHFGRYAYANQPAICRDNLELLQAPLKRLIAPAAMTTALAKYATYYTEAYQQRMLNKLGFADLEPSNATELLKLTLQFLHKSQVGYHDFFTQLTQQFSPTWRDQPDQIFANFNLPEADSQARLEQWRSHYYKILASAAPAECDRMAARLQLHNPTTVPLRPLIETVWAAIAQTDDWTSFHDLLTQIRA
jgi:serine/tyrosine/threonine adenylyltransferase